MDGGRSLAPPFLLHPSFVTSLLLPHTVRTSTFHHQLFPPAPRIHNPSTPASLIPPSSFHTHPLFPRSSRLRPASIPRFLPSCPPSVSALPPPSPLIHHVSPCSMIGPSSFSPSSILFGCKPPRPTQTHIFRGRTSSSTKGLSGSGRGSSTEGRSCSARTRYSLTPHTFRGPIRVPPKAAVAAGACGTCTPFTRTRRGPIGSPTEGRSGSGRMRYFHTPQKSS